MNLYCLGVGNPLVVRILPGYPASIWSALTCWPGLVLPSFIDPIGTVWDLLCPLPNWHAIQIGSGLLATDLSTFRCPFQIQLFSVFIFTWLHLSCKMSFTLWLGVRFPLTHSVGSIVFMADDTNAWYKWQPALVIIIGRPVCSWYGTIICLPWMVKIPLRVETICCDTSTFSHMTWTQ